MKRFQENDERGEVEMRDRYRAGYLLATAILLGIEILIALFVHDRFVRPYVGDVLVVILLYCFVRILMPRRGRFLPLYIFLFAAAVEVLQLFSLVDRLGLGENRFFRVLIGSVFDWKDILCYGVGCLLLAGWEYFLYRKKGFRRVKSHLCYRRKK